MFEENELKEYLKSILKINKKCEAIETNLREKIGKILGLEISVTTTLINGRYLEVEVHLIEEKDFILTIDHLKEIEEIVGLGTLEIHASCGGLYCTKNICAFKEELDCMHCDDCAKIDI